MKYLYNLMGRFNFSKHGFFIAALLFLAGNKLNAQIYQHNFGTTTISAHPYNVAPGIIDANLSGSSWSNSTSAWTSFAGSAGQAISLNNSGGTPTITLSLNITAGNQASISSFSFWRQRSGTGAQNWSMTINGISVGSGTVPTTGASIGTVAVGSPVNNQTGTLTIVLSLSGASGTGTFRLDDFTMNGTVVPAPTLSGNTLTGFGNICINTVTGANTFGITGTALTAANVTVGPLAGFTFSPNNGVFTNTLSIAQPGGAFSQTVYVKFSPLLVQSYNGDIPVGGGGAPTINVAATGTGVNTKPTIDNGTVNTITTNSANVNATISLIGCSAISGYGVEYSTTPGFANGGGTPVPGGVLSAGNFTSNLVGLAPPGQTYYFHTYATNAGGTTYGNEGSFTLLNTIPTLSVPATGAGSLSGFGNACINTSLVNSFNLSGSVLNGSNITIGPLANYTFSTALAGTYTNSLTLVNGGAGYSYTGTAITATIYVKFIPTAVTNYNGNIAISGAGATAINVAATGAGINSAPIVLSGNAIFVTTNSATLPGTISDPGCGVTLGYGIEYFTAPFTPGIGTGTVIPASNLASGNFSVDLSSLLSNTTYYYYAYAINAGGTGYGAPINFTTFSVPTKLVITAISPTSPIALTPFSITVQSQDNSGTPVDVITDTDIQLSQVGGTGTFTFPNSNSPAAVMLEGANTITISGLLYDVIETVGLTATASAGMTGLGTSITNTFNVVGYNGSTNFIWNNAAGSAWINGANWTTNPTSPGVGGGVNDDIATFSSNAGVTGGGIGINMTTVTGDFNLGAIYFNQNYTAAGVAGFGNSSGSITGTFTLHGAPLNNVGGIAGNNFSKLFLANYMNNGTRIMEIKNSVGGVQTMTLALIDTAGTIAAGVGDTININVLLTGTKTLTFAGGGALSLLPSGAATTNTFSGAIIVAKGSLLAGSSGAFSTVAPNPITLGSTAANAGRLRLMGNSVTIGGLSTAGTAGNSNIADNNSSSPATLTVNNSSANSFNGSLQNGSTGALSLIKLGAGNLTLSGLSTYSGTTTVNAGTLILARVGGGTIASGSIVFVNGTGILRVSSDQTIKDISLATGGTLRVDAGVTLTITGSYNAATCNIINNGTIKLQGTSALQTFPGTAAVVSPMNNLTINNLFGVNLNNSLNIGGTLNLNAGTFTVGAYTLTLNNPITGTLTNFSANNTSSIVIAGTAAGVNIPAVVTQLKALTVSNTVGSVLQGPLNVSTTLFISAGTLDDNQFVLNGNANTTMTGGVLNLQQNTATLPGLAGVYSLTGGTVIFDGVGVGTDAQTVRPINYFNLTSAANGDRILSPTGTIGVSNVFTPNLPNNAYTILNSTVDFNKTSNQPVAGFTYYNMTVSGGGAIVKTLSGDASIQGTLTLATNTKFALATFNTTLKSNASGTANVAVINTINSISYGTGKFIVERYIPTGVAHGKTWQLLAVPVSGTQSVNASWQEGNVLPAVGPTGFGTTISSEKPGSAGVAGRGYDFYTSVAPSIKTYNSVTNAWDGIDDGATNTSSLPIANMKGYMIFVRGDRNVQTSGAAATVTTLRTSGKIYSPGTDAPPFSTVTAGKLESVGNAYASAIDFTNLVTTSTGIDSKYYVWDPLLAGTNGYGGYQLLSSANLWKPVPGGTLNYPTGVAYTKIQSGQAFFVYSTGGGTVNFAESNKTSGSSLLYRAAVNTGRQFFRAWVYNANGVLADGNAVVFDPAFSNAFDADDAIKLATSTESFAVSSNNKELALQARKTVINSDTVFYNLSNLNIHPYQLRFEPENMDAGGLVAFLVDRFLGTTSPLSLTGSTMISFTVTADPASKAVNRFYVVFRPTGPVPVRFVGIAANRNIDKNIDVDWNVVDETGIDHYDIERSGDGRNFSVIGTTTALANNGGNAAYQFVDTRYLKGNNFYRIKSVGLGSNIQYSAIARVGEINEAPAISIYPNPVVDKTINLSFINQPQGHYDIRLSNKLGQVVYKASVDINESYIIKSFNPGNEIAAGLYLIDVSSGNNSFRQQVIIK